MNYKSLSQTFIIIVYICVTTSALELSARADAVSEDRNIDVIPLDQAVQEAISRVVAAFSPEGGLTEAGAYKVVEEYKRLKNKTSQELLLQVLAVYGGKDEYRLNPRAEWAKRFLISSMLQDMTPLDIVAAVAPKFEQSTDRKVSHSLRLALDMVIFRGGRVQPDFTAICIFIEQNKKQPPQKLISYIYSHDPRCAMLSIAHIIQDNAAESELVDILKGEPKMAMESLAVRDEWWARLYVAKMMEQHPALRDSDLVKRLQGDIDPLVRRTAASLAGSFSTNTTSAVAIVSKRIIKTFDLNIPFKSDKADVAVEVYPQLDEIAQMLKTNLQLIATIEGHTDKTKKSNASYSKRLTERRAQAVLEYLARSGGIESNRMTAVGCGFLSPKVLNDPESGNIKNRRIEVHIQEPFGSTTVTP